MDLPKEKIEKVLKDKINSKKFGIYHDQRYEVILQNSKENKS